MGKIIFSKYLLLQLQRNKNQLGSPLSFSLPVSLPLSLSLLFLSPSISCSLTRQGQIYTMKRTIPWSDEEDDSSDDESLSSHSDSGAEDGVDKKKAKDPSKHSKEKNSKAKSRKKKTGVLDFEELKRRGYKGGPSILSVPPPKEDDKQDWSWSTGKESRETKETEESYEERQKTRAALASGEQLVSVETWKDRKNLSFSQKEKRKRELGQASRGKNYVEEEKRLLRENGIYSGFDA